MCDLGFCVGCLATDVKMFTLSTSGLLSTFQAITGIQDSIILQKLCWECTALVNKFNAFRLKCKRAHTLLQDTYMMHGEVKRENLCKIDRKVYNLCSNLSICNARNLKVESVKTKNCTNFEMKRNKKYMQESHEMQNNEMINVAFEKTDYIEKEIDHECNQIIADKEFIDEYEEVSKARTKVHSELDVSLKAEMKTEPYDYNEESNISVNSLEIHTEKDSEDFRAIKSKKASIKSKKKRMGENLLKSTKVTANDFGMEEEILTQNQWMLIMSQRLNSDSYKTANYRCNLCSKTFKDSKAFANHTLLHEQVSGQYICDVCKLRYKSRRQLSIHISTMHSRKYTCLSCSEVFYNRTIAQKHYSWHKGVVYTCNICGETFRKHTSHRNHLRLKHRWGHICAECGLDFISEKGLVQHKGLMHKINIDPGKAKEIRPNCETCKVQFSNQQAWTKHVLTCLTHIGDRNKIANGCKACGKTFVDKSDLNKHRKSHSAKVEKKEPGSFSCEQCDKTLSSYVDYRSHLKLSHPGCQPTRQHKSSYVCEQCGKMFRTKMHLRLHTYVHTGERPYECAVCRKSFNTPYNLQVHKRVHTKEQPFICDVCNQEFSNKSNLNRHRKMHSNEKPYKCDACVKSFNSSSKLAVHRRVHTKELPYLCNECGRGFANKTNMNRHKSVHTDAKPYSCDACGKSFKSRPYLREHIAYTHQHAAKRDRKKKNPTQQACS